MKKRVDVGLNEQDYEFIEWLAKRDYVNFHEEMKMIFYTELSALEDLYLDEMLQEKEVKE